MQTVIAPGESDQIWARHGRQRPASGDLVRNLDQSRLKASRFRQVSARVSCADERLSRLLRHRRVHCWGPPLSKISSESSQYYLGYDPGGSAAKPSSARTKTSPLAGFLASAYSPPVHGICFGIFANPPIKRSVDGSSEVVKKLAVSAGFNRHLCFRPLS